jgi:acyl-CoA thioesterase II
MAQSIQDLLDVLDLEQIDLDLYRGRSPATSLQRVFGGQVACQALVAAGRTVQPERGVHSLHAYFLRPGDPTAPIVYPVERVRDGRSFTTRRVVARQRGRPIFTMSASFQGAEPGLEHQDPMPEVPAPEDVPSIEQRQERLAEQGRRAGGRDWDDALRVFRAIELRPIESWPGDNKATQNNQPQAPHSAHARAWIRVRGRLPDDPLVHVCALAYLSDLTLLSATLVPHRRSPFDGSVQMASLDHAMWFHRAFRADEWLLYDQISPFGGGARGLATGRFFDAAGALIASVMQEGLIRPVDG